MLQDKTLIITGAGSGIGKKAAEVFAAHGAAVVLADRNEEAVAAAAQSIRAQGGKSASFRCDVTCEEDVEALVNFTLKTFGVLHGALNNAGVEMHNKPVHEITAAEWRRVLDVDLTGTFLCLKHEFRVMKDTGGGSIVNTASTSGLRGHPNAAEYVAAKHGVVGLSKSAAIDGGPLGIRVNALCPGLILTPMAQDRLMNDPVFAEALAGLRQRHIIGRFGETHEVAHTAMWLLSDHSSFTTGTATVVDGGYAI